MKERIGEIERERERARSHVVGNYSRLTAKRA